MSGNGSGPHSSGEAPGLGALPWELTLQPLRTLEKLGERPSPAPA